jgi:hypothetical protein
MVRQIKGWPETITITLMLYINFSYYTSDFVVDVVEFTFDDRVVIALPRFHIPNDETKNHVKNDCNFTMESATGT